jgi:hypothetical protein
LLFYAVLCGFLHSVGDKKIPAGKKEEKTRRDLKRSNERRWLIFSVRIPLIKHLPMERYSIAKGLANF